MMMRCDFQVGLLYLLPLTYDSTNRPTCSGLYVCVRMVEQWFFVVIVIDRYTDDNGQNSTFIDAYTLFYEYDDEAHRWVDWSY